MNLDQIRSSEFLAGHTKAEHYFIQSADNCEFIAGAVEIKLNDPSSIKIKSAKIL